MVRREFAGTVQAIWCARNVPTSRWGSWLSDWDEKWSICKTYGDICCLHPGAGAAN